MTTNPLFKRLERFLKTDLTYLTKGGFWLTAAKIVGALTSLASSLVFANYLPEETYGMFRYVLSIFVLFSILTLSGLDSALVKAIAKGSDGTTKVALFEKIKFGAFATVLSLFFSGYYYINGNDVLGIIFLISALCVPIMEAFYIFVAHLNGKKDFFRTALYVSATRITTTILLITAVLFTDKIIVIISTYLLSHLTLRALFFVLTLRKYPLNTKVDYEALHFGKHLTVTQGVTQLAGNLDKILIFNFVSGASLAGYYLALVPFKQVNNIFSSLLTLALPKLAQKDPQQIQRQLPALLMKLYIIIVPIIIVYWLTADTIFNVLMPRYVEYAFFSKLIMLLLLLYPVNIINTVLTSQNAKKELYQVTFGASISRIILLFICVPLYGVWGAVGVVLGTHVLQSFLTAFVYINFIRKTNVTYE